MLILSILVVLALLACFWHCVIWSEFTFVVLLKLQKQKERAISDIGAEKLIPEQLKSAENLKDKKHRKEKKDKEDRKREKKDKEERRKEKKEKKREEKASAPADNAKQVDVGKLPKAGNVAFESKWKLQGRSTELLEKSSVTEEHGQPIEAQNTSCSSDSTGNSGKRKRVSAPPCGIQSSGNVIRIRLSSSQNRDEPSTSGVKEQEVGLVPQAASQNHVFPGVNLVQQESSVKLKDSITNGLALPRTSSNSTATVHVVPTVEHVTTHLKEKTIEKLSSRDKKMQKKEALFKKLFVDWVPPPLETTLVVDENEDDEEWLFGKKGEDRSAKRLRVSEECQSLGDNINIPCSVSVVMQPRAQFLADVGVYALPYTVPF